MENATPLIAMVITFTGLLVFGTLAAHGMGTERRRATARMRAITQDTAQLRPSTLRNTTQRGAAAKPARGWVEKVVARLNLLKSKEAAGGRTLLARAGIRSESALTNYLFMRICTPALFGAGFLLDVNLLHLMPIPAQWSALACCVATVVGFYAPIFALKNKITKRQAALKKSLPDGIDLLVICLEAGTSINESFGRVGRELARGHPALAEEFAITSAELAFLPVRRTALENLMERTGLPAIRGIVTTMLQSERFGTPIAQSLRVLSAEFRDQRMMAAEEKAAKLPVLLTVPMMLFILPVLFIVLLGPAALSILDAMAKQ